MSMNDKNLGFKIAGFLDLFDWKTFEVDPGANWVSNLNCPCDDTALKTVTTFFGNNGAQKIRVGVCRSCGYIGYIDRPTKDWIKDFYLNTWEDTGSPKVKKLVRKIKHGQDKKQREILEMLAGINIDKSRPICEIGCGYGSTLNQIKNMGFSNLTGIENSKHRADFAKTFFGLDILTSPFEDSTLQSKLREKAPYSLIFSHHVFEHVYDPGELIKLSSDLQSEGDYFAISLPNAAGEFTMSNLLYFPHLHSFTTLSLKKLLNKYHYEVVDESLTNKQAVHLLARKVGYIPNQTEPAKDYFNITLEKFSRGLGLNFSHPYSPRRMWWYRAFNVGGQIRFLQNNFLDKAYWDLSKKIMKYKYRNEIINEVGKKEFDKKQPIQSILIEDLKNRYTTVEESPVEIQFDKNIILTYK